MSKRRRSRLERHYAPDGTYLCSCGCGRKPEPPRQTWYSDECVHQYKLRADPGYLRNQVFRRDKGVCHDCGTDIETLQEQCRNSGCYRLEREFRRTAQALGLQGEAQEAWIARALTGEIQARKARRRHYEAIYGTVTRSWWQADHDTPVHLGGGECGLDNMVTRCTVCHNRKSALEAQARARARKEQAGQKELPLGTEKTL